MTHKKIDLKRYFKIFSSFECDWLKPIFIYCKALKIKVLVNSIISMDLAFEMLFQFKEVGIFW